MREKIKLKGICTIIVRDRNGKILSVERKENVITDAGREHVAKLLGGLETAHFSYIQIGRGMTPPSSSDTSLEVYYAEKEASVSFKGLSSVVFAATFSFSESVMISESGIFSGPQETSPVMLCRQVFAGKSMTAGQYLEVVWTIGVA